MHDSLFDMAKFNNSIKDVRNFKYYKQKLIGLQKRLNDILFLKQIKFHKRLNGSLLNEIDELKDEIRNLKVDERKNIKYALFGDAFKPKSM